MFSRLPLISPAGILVLCTLTYSLPALRALRNSPQLVTRGVSLSLPARGTMSLAVKVLVLA